jgi:nicotinate-nucleotide adenylyltransferase
LIKIKNCAIYGGTFDPIHLGHIHLVEWLLTEGKFDRVIVVPAGAPWQRSTHASAKHRLAMVGIALSKWVTRGAVEISECEIKRGGATYAIETVRELNEIYQSEGKTWVLGSDAFSGIESWKDVDELARLIDFLVINRPGSKVIEPAQTIRWRSVEIEALDISASEIRNRLGSGLSISGLVPDPVADYIKEHGLYGVA